jgi:cysteine-rich repeat protein
MHKIGALVVFAFAVGCSGVVQDPIGKSGNQALKGGAAAVNQMHIKNDARCGDGVVGPGEECDDGNTDNGDGCTESCSFEGGEGGDHGGGGDDGADGGTGGGDGGMTGGGDGGGGSCLCGNGVVDPGEQCDDGNNTCGDGCSEDCKLEL